MKGLIIGVAIVLLALLTIYSYSHESRVIQREQLEIEMLPD